MSVMSLALGKRKVHCFAACFIYMRCLNLCYKAIKTFDASILDVQVNSTAIDLSSNWFKLAL